MVYFISLPLSYFGKLLNVYVQSPAISLDCTSSPLAIKVTVILSGRLPSWLSLSFQVFVPLISTVSVLCVLLMIYPSVALPLISDVYPFGTDTSAILYWISLPFFLASRSVNDPLQLFFSSSVNVLSVFSPFANNSTVIFSGRIPSWLLLSFQIFLTLTLVLPTLCVFVKSLPFWVVV